MNSNHLFQPTSGCLPSKLSRAMEANMPGSCTTLQSPDFSVRAFDDSLLWARTLRYLYVETSEWEKKHIPELLFGLFAHGSQRPKEQRWIAWFHISDCDTFIWIYNAGAFWRRGGCILHTHSAPMCYLFLRTSSTYAVFETGHSFINAKEGFPSFRLHLKWLFVYVMYILLKTLLKILFVQSEPVSTT